MIYIGEHAYDGQLVVFDKDGLMFESRTFWIQLAQSRVEAAKKKYGWVPNEVLESWMKFVGAKLDPNTKELKVVDMDYNGIFAIAPVPEELIVAATYFAEHLRLDWVTAREIATDIFKSSEENFDLRNSLKPKKGFPDILVRLREAGIPYGIATSDTVERAKQSIDFFDDSKYLEFVVTVDDVKNGKPAPDMLMLISKRSGIATDKMVMVGDSFVDVAMAKAAGSIGIGIPEYSDMKEKMADLASEIITSLDEIQFR